jgi:ribosomal protein L13
MTAKIAHEQLFADAIATSEPVLRLREVVRGMLAQGQSKEDVLAELDRFRGTLHQARQEAAEDVVLDVMDFLVGWASPHMKV